MGTETPIQTDKRYKLVDFNWIQLKDSSFLLYFNIQSYFIIPKDLYYPPNKHFCLLFFFLRETTQTLFLLFQYHAAFHYNFSMFNLFYDIRVGSLYCEWKYPQEMITTTVKQHVERDKNIAVIPFVFALQKKKKKRKKEKRKKLLIHTHLFFVMIINYNLSHAITFISSPLVKISIRFV